MKIRYKLPKEDKSRLTSQPIFAAGNSEVSALQEVSFATAVAGFAQLLQGGKYTGEWTYDDALALAMSNKGEDHYGYRAEFIRMVRQAKIAAVMQ